MCVSIPVCPAELENGVSKLLLNHTIALGMTKKLSFHHL